MPLSKERMREYQRERRERQKKVSCVAGIIVRNAEYVLGEKEPVVQTSLRGSDVVKSAGSDSGLPWPLNLNKSPRWGAGVDHYIAPTEEEKDAMNRRGLERSRVLREARKNR